jgi:hypothetical protein
MIIYMIYELFLERYEVITIILFIVIHIMYLKQKWIQLQQTI